MRKKLIDFLKEKEIIVDKVFLTGDYRDASCQAGSDEAAANIAKYILDVACTVGVNDVENILLVPGNHDLQRDFANVVLPAPICPSSANTLPDEKTESTSFATSSNCDKSFTLYTFSISLYLFLRCMKGMSTSSIDMPPCWKVFL